MWTVLDSFRIGLGLHGMSLQAVWKPVNGFWQRSGSFWRGIVFLFLGFGTRQGVSNWILCVVNSKKQCNRHFASMRSMHRSARFSTMLSGLLFHMWQWGSNWYMYTLRLSPTLQWPNEGKYSGLHAISVQTSLTAIANSFQYCYVDWRNLRCKYFLCVREFFPNKRVAQANLKRFPYL